MAYTDQNTPVVQQVTLPSGNSYYIADRQLRNDFDSFKPVVLDSTGGNIVYNGSTFKGHEYRLGLLEEMIAGGVSFIIAWDGSSTPNVSAIPAGVTVTYQGTTYTGTLSPETEGSGTHAQPGAFYLVRSSTEAGVKDSYDEYVPIGSTGSKTWQKIGDTQIDLTNVVTDVAASTVQVVGNNASISYSNPSASLSTYDSSASGRVQVVTKVGSVTASGDSVTALTGLGTASTVAAWTGGSASAAAPAMSGYSSSSTGRAKYVETASANTTKLSASASGTVTVMTELGTPSTQAAVQSVTPSTAKLATGTVTGVTSSTTTASKATHASITYADGTDTASTVNTNFIKGMSVTNGVLSFGAATLDTATESFSDVTVPIKASSASTFATGSTTSSGSGASVVTGVEVGSTFSAVTGYASPTTTTALKGSPTITISSGSTGDVTVATGISATTKYMAASTSSVTPGSTTNVVTGYASPTTDSVIGSDSTISLASTSKYIGASLSGGSATLNKDSTTVVSTISVTKGT